MTISSAFNNASVFAWDFFLTIIAFITPNLKVGHVVPAGHPGAGGQWPEYVPPGEGDSRSACPMLNALANHGILPHDGKNIPFVTMTDTVRSTYNFSSSFCYFVPNVIAGMLKKDYSTDTFDLEEISLHNGIEHDASLTREDTFHQPDQGKPHAPFINELLLSASGKDPKVSADAENPESARKITFDDIARFTAKRRTEAKARNPEFALSTFHKFAGSSNNTGLINILGGHVDDLRQFLIEERIPDGWESAERSRVGLTIGRINFTVVPLEMSSRRYMKALTKQSDAPSASYGATE